MAFSMSMLPTLGFFNQGSGFRLLLDKVKRYVLFFLCLLLSLVLGILTVFDRGRGHSDMGPNRYFLAKESGDVARYHLLEYNRTSKY